MKRYAALIFFVLISVFSYAQNDAYMIPRIIFVGDPAVLILPVSGDVPADIILTEMSPNFPSHPNIDFHRIILEKRAGVKRLMIEFTAFVPGTLEFPVIEIGNESFSGIVVTVNSIIDNKSSPVLSGAASSLAMPGTALMLYGSMALLIVLFLFAIWFILKGRKYFKKLIEKYRRWRLFAAIKKLTANLYKAAQKEENNRLILDKLSDEFRIFLSFLTANNCRTMTASEFKKLKLPEYQGIAPSFLYDFFHKCDELRFSGGNISSKDILGLLDDFRKFIEEAEMPAEIPAEKLLYEKALHKGGDAA